MLSEIQDIMNNHVGRVLITPNQEGTMEMWDEVLSSVDAEYMDTRGYQLSDLDDVEFHWQNDRLDIDAVFTTLSPSAFNDFDRDSMAEKPILFDGKQDKENAPPAPPLPTTSVSEKPTQRNRCVDEKSPIWNKN